MQRLFSTIRGRLTISHLALVVVAMGLAGALLFSLLRGYFLQALEDSLVAQARITAQALLPGAVALGPAGEGQDPAYNTVNTIQQQDNITVQTQNLVPGVSLEDLDLALLAESSVQLSAQLQTRIRILDVGGRVLIDSAQEQQGADLAGDALVQQALRGQYASRVGREEPAAMHVAVPVLLEGRPAGVVYLSQPLGDVNAVLGDLRSFWLLSSGLILLLSVGAGLLLSRTFSRPLGRLTAAAAAVSQGDLEAQVPVRSADELGRLSAAFNQMTARLRAAHRMQVDFVANVSHELRTPLSSIKGLLETLRGGAVDDPQVRDPFLETADRETDRLIRLVNDLLLLSRVDSAALELRRRPVDLAGLVQAAWRRLAQRAQEKGASLLLQTAPELPPAWGDPDRLLQVLVNLLDNALKYSPPDSAVTVRIGEEPDGLLRLQVEDRGCGIPEEALQHIGERFYRVERDRSRGEGGSGLGLAIARSLVQAHGGRLWLQSSEGVGTTVSLTLPPEPQDGT
ncbi:MAG: HAMP domain-containing protein [Chloroflexia bacterium]|nr:HAMP domain-containing protein [Chloroflexia bacterium]